MSDDIPFEIQIEIIKRVPVKSLIRFRSVSKTWRSLIDSSEFIAGYRARKTQPRSLLVRYINRSDNRSVNYVSVNSDTFTQQQDLTPNVPALMKPSVLIGYSRGLLCLYSFFLKGGMLVLWNPSLRRCVSIDASFEITRLVGNSIIGYTYLSDLFGFAVCPVTNDAIIVKLAFPWKVETFTLSSKRWTVIQCSKPRDRECESVSLHEGIQVVIDGCIYRVAYDTIRLQNGSFTYQFMIVSFDLNVKEFKVIDLPDTITNPPFTSPIRFILSKLKGSLVVIVHRIEIREIKVWKMEPDCSFTQLFTINTSYFLTTVVGFRKNGELVVETQERPGRSGYAGPGATALEAYDPCSKRITNLGMSGQSGSFFISSYKETLLLLDHSDSCEYPEFN